MATAPGGAAPSLHGTDTSSDVEAEDGRHAARGSMSAGNAGKIPGCCCAQNIFKDKMGSRLWWFYFWGGIFFAPLFPS